MADHLAHAQYRSGRWTDRVVTNVTFSECKVKMTWSVHTLRE